MRPNAKGNDVQESGRKSRPCKFSQNENANARPNQMQQKSSCRYSDMQNSIVDKQMVNGKTWKKSQTTEKCNGKKIQGTYKKVHDRQRLQSQTGSKEVRQSRKENPQRLTQLSSRSHPRHLVGKRTAQKDTIIDITSDSQVNSNFPYR